jgi:hypothetical protein
VYGLIIAGIVFAVMRMVRRRSSVAASH